jgi:hypothetical protein
MRVEMNDRGELSATAETLDEAQGLLTFVNMIGGRKKKAATNKVPKKRKRTNSKECPICQKRKKYMGLHYRLAHPGIEYKKEIQL